jgi:hypothetical protein
VKQKFGAAKSSEAISLPTIRSIAVRQRKNIVVSML